jgi:ABC-type branched-subunit amino acid transport system permease subunit
MSVTIDRVSDRTAATPSASRRGRERPYAVLAVLAVMLSLPFVVNPFYLGVVVLGAIYAVAVLGLHFLMGLTGQLSLAQGAFFGVGAYTAAILSTRYDVPFYGTLSAAVVAGIVLGLALGYATLRLTGHYLALATIGFAVIAHIVFLQWRPVTNGADGIAGTTAPTIGGIVFDQDFYYFYIVWAVLAVLALLGWKLKHSRVGRAFLAVREDELAAASNGIDVLNYKVLAFTLSTVYGCIAGGLYAHGLTHYISPDNFVFDLSVTMLVMLLLGGQASVPGAIIGSMLVTALPEGLRFLDRYYLVVYGALVILLVIYLPQGLWGVAEGRFSRRRAGRAMADQEPRPDAAAAGAEAQA